MSDLHPQHLFAAQPHDREPVKKRKASKRASVPSWDDIVFGARKPTE